MLRNSNKKYTVWHKKYTVLAKIGLSFLSRCTKSSLLKFKPLNFVGFLYLFCMVAIHLQNWCKMYLLNQCELLLPLKISSQQLDWTFHSCQQYKSNDTIEPWLTFLKLSKVYEMGHELIEIFYIHLSGR